MVLFVLIIPGQAYGPLCVNVPWAGLWSSFVLMTPGKAFGPLLCQVIEGQKCHPY